jgi:cell volume regulation protein A
MAGEIKEAYGAVLKDGEAELTIGDMMAARLGGHAEYADRVPLGPIELIVRDVDEDGRIESSALRSSRRPVEPVRQLSCRRRAEATARRAGRRRRVRRARVRRNAKDTTASNLTRREPIANLAALHRAPARVSPPV